MKPIAQTFYINEPDNGVAGVYLTSVELFFKSKSQTFGVQVQIRPTDNGNPTTSVMPFGDTRLPSSMVKVSDDASLGTLFNFSSPIFLQSSTSYAIVIIPIGSNPEYEIWTAELGQTDVTTKAPIKTNNDTGTLFLSSNDIQFTSILTEDIKFNIYIADFSKGGTTVPQGTAVFTSRDSDYLLINDKRGSFNPKEYAVISNNHHRNAVFTYGGTGQITGTFVSGDVIYQTNTTAGPTGIPTVTAKIYSIDTGTFTIKVQDINVVNVDSGGFSPSKGRIWGNREGTKAVTIQALTDPLTKVVTTAGSNSVAVPYTEMYTAGQMVYIGTNERTEVYPTTITSKNSSNLYFSTDVPFSDTDAIIGRIRGDGKLYAKIEISDTYANPNRIQATLGEVTSTETDNFYRSRGQFLIGAYSGASANIIMTSDSNYNTIVPQFAESKPGDTNIDWSFSGTVGLTTTPDTYTTTLTNNIEKELYDYPRILMSRSNEWSPNLPSNRRGDPSTKIYASMVAANSMISPIIDTAKNVVDVIGNTIARQNQLSGYRLIVARNADNINPTLPANNDNHNFKQGDRLIQRNFDVPAGQTPTYLGGADLSYYNEDTLIITNVSGFFSQIANVNVMLYNPGDLTAGYNNNTSIVSSSYFSEENNNNLKFASRYISKNVVLADGQDAEDIRLYLTAYRPANTDLLVYVRILNGEDPGAFDNKSWTLLNQITSPGLLSSTANKDDLIEIEYGFPIASEISAEGVKVRVPATRYFPDTAVDLAADKIKINIIEDDVFLVGDRVQYITDTDVTAVGGLANNEYYYIKTVGLDAKTFNGSTDVNTTTNKISISSNPFVVGDRVLYKSVTSAAIAPLSNNSWYYVKTADGSSVTLSATATGPILGLSKGVSDTGHSLSSQFIQLSDTEDGATKVLTTGATPGTGHRLMTDDWINVTDTSRIRVQDFVYFADATTDSNKFFVAQVRRKGKTNKRNLSLIQDPPFPIDNAKFGVIKNLQWATCAFLYPDNNNIVRYVSGAKNGTNAVYDGYKQFAVKIVPVSDTTSLVPRVKDMRAIALQI